MIFDYPLFNVRIFLTAVGWLWVFWRESQNIFWKYSILGNMWNNLWWLL